MLCLTLDHSLWSRNRVKNEEAASRPTQKLVQGEEQLLKGGSSLYLAQAGQSLPLLSICVRETLFFFLPGEWLNFAFRGHCLGEDHSEIFA